eukprot:8959809-Pyramimonas_sp.AAC.1
MSPASSTHAQPPGDRTGYLGTRAEHADKGRSREYLVFSLSWTPHSAHCQNMNQALKGSIGGPPMATCLCLSAGTLTSGATLVSNCSSAARTTTATT